MALVIDIVIGIMLAVFLIRAFDAWRQVRAYNKVTERFVSRSGFRPLPMQRAAIDQILERERDAREANETAQERYRIARGRRLHQLNHPELY